MEKREEVGGMCSRLSIEKQNPLCSWFRVGAPQGRGDFPPLLSRNLRHGFIFLAVKHVQ